MREAQPRWVAVIGHLAAAVAPSRICVPSDRFVALNLYASALGQRSFPYTEAVFMEKLDCVALMLAAWGCSDYVRAFFRAPVAPRNGLPSRPRVDTAVTLRLNSSPAWDPAAVEEWFTS